MYYYQPLNIKNHVNMNVSNNVSTDPKITAQTTELNRNILSEYGDVVFNGRFGQAIKFGSDPYYLYPDIKITNGQSVPLQKTQDEYYPHVQNINDDGSSIFMTSGPAREVDVLIPAVQTLTTPDVLDGDMITLNSDRIVFNSKQTDIHMFARRNLNLSANEEINLELGINAIGGRITLGDAESTNPMVLGNQLEGLFEKFHVDSVYGMHNWVGLEAGHFGVGVGPIMAAADTFDLIINGKGGHAAMPHQCIDPIIVASQVLTALQSISSRNTHPVDSLVISVTQIHAGDAYNIIPDTVKMHGTVRTFLSETRDEIPSKMLKVSEGVCHAMGASCELNYIHGYPATVNSITETDISAKAAIDLVGEDKVVRNPTPSMASEDFSYMLQAVRKIL